MTIVIAKVKVDGVKEKLLGLKAPLEKTFRQSDADHVPDSTLNMGDYSVFEQEALVIEDLLYVLLVISNFIFGGPIPPIDCFVNGREWMVKLFDGLRKKARIWNHRHSPLTRLSKHQLQTWFRRFCLWLAFIT